MDDKSEIPAFAEASAGRRNPKSETISNVQISKIRILNLFRVSSFEFRVFTQRRGAALLLSLLILGSLVAASMTVGIVVTTNLRSVRAIDDAIVASYTAESGIEEVLYMVRKKDAPLFDPQTGEPITLQSEAKLSVEKPPTQLFFDLTKDDVEQFDINGGAQAVSLSIITTGCSTGWCPFLDVTWSALEASGGWLSPRGQLIALNNTGSITSILLGTEKMFRIRMRSLYGNVGSVYVTASNDNGLVEFNSRIVATVTGVFGSAKQAYRVEFLRHAPLSPIFDHVLFSECDIVKGGAANCP